MDTPELDETLRSERADIRIVKEGKLLAAIEVRKVPFLIGRVESDLNIDDTAVSRKHCSIDHQEGRWIFRDLGSSNGSMVNGEKVAERQLHDGDTVKIGQTEMKFTIRKRSGPQGSGGGVAESFGNQIEGAALSSVLELNVGVAESKSWMNAYLGTVMKQFDADRGSIVAYDAVTGSHVPIAVIAMELDESPDKDKIPLSRSIIDEAIGERKIVMTTNAEVDPRFKDATSVAQYDIAGVICAPTRWHGNPIGALYLERAVSKKPFTEGESLQLQDLADLFGTTQMAWRGHGSGDADEMERERLRRHFDEGTANGIVGRGGASAIRRMSREVCMLCVYLSKTDELIASGNEEAWRMISQFYAQINGILQRRGGALVSPGCALFGSLDNADKGFHMEAVHAGVEIQRVGRPLIKRMVRDMKVGFGVCVGVAGGGSLVGYFGAGSRVDYMGIGGIIPTSMGMAFQGEDGEVLVEQTVYNKIRLHFKTHRMAPVMLPGARGLTQLFRIVPY